MMSTLPHREMHARNLNQTNATAYGADHASALTRIGPEALQQLALLVVIQTSPSHAFHGYSMSRTVSDQTKRMFFAAIGPALSNLAIELIPSAVKAEWLLIAEGSRAELCFNQISRIISCISKSLHAADFGKVDADLAQADFSKMSADAFVAVSRITYPARNELQNWKQFVLRAREEMESRGEVENLMTGLV